MGFGAFARRLLCLLVAAALLPSAPVAFADGGAAGAGAGGPSLVVQSPARTPITQARIGKIGRCVYRGFPLAPSCSVAYGGSRLAEGVDYRLTYKGNDRPGWASVTVAGIGAFRGSVTKKFKIVPMKYVMVGDSYSTPYRKGPAFDRVMSPWPELVARKLGLDETSCSVVRKGKHGFARPGYQFKKLFKNAKRDTDVTDVLIVGGVGNDRYCSRARAMAGYAQFIALMKRIYPRARIMHTTTSWWFGHESYCRKVAQRIPWYRQAARENGVYYLAGCEGVLRSHPEWVRSDGRHPNQAGAKAIASSVFSRVRKLDRSLSRS